MKKEANFIILFLIINLLAGCSDDQYSIEKKYWKLKMQAKEIFDNPLASPPNQLEKMVSNLSSFGNKYSETKLAVEANFIVAELYIAKKEFKTARAQLKFIINKYSNSKQVCANALFLTGKSYELEGRWEAALQSYKKILDDYPNTKKGIEIPIYIAQYYKAKHQPDKMLVAYQEAISHYQTLGSKHANSPLGYTARNLTARCYIAVKDWQNAISIYNTILETYKDKIVMDKLLLNMAMIYKKELNNDAKAKASLEKLIKDYPKSRLVKPAASLLKELNK